MEARVRMRDGSDRGEEPHRGGDSRRWEDPPRGEEGRCARACGRDPRCGRACSPLAGLFLLATVTSLTVLASLLYWQPSILSAGIAGVSKGPLAAAADWVRTGSDLAHAHARQFWGGFLGGVFALWLAYRVMAKACCRRMLFFVTALLTTPLAIHVLHHQWPAIVELMSNVPKQ